MTEEDVLFDINKFVENYEAREEYLTEGKEDDGTEGTI